MAKKIEFVARNPFFWDVAPKPFPASEAVPKWWKDARPYAPSPEDPKGTKLIIENKVANLTFKKCTPMLDAITSGYIVPLWSDVQIRPTEGGAPRITWRQQEFEVFQTHGIGAEHVQRPKGYSSIVFKYMNPWIPKTPPGYSVLITTPFGYRDTPFYAIPAVIDSDRSTLEILSPVWVREGFEGIVERGTPMFQVTPFKREEWKSEFSHYEAGEYDKIEAANFNATLVNHYIRKVWSKKTYK